MPFANNECDELPEQCSCSADNSALYTALTGAVGISDIGEKAEFSIESGYRLIRVDHRLDEVGGHEFEIALVDDVEFSVAYYAKVTLLQIPAASSRPVARHRVWRSASMRHSQVLRDISRAVLYSYLVHDYDLLFTEDALMGNGKFYWFRQVSRAIELGLHVCTYDSTKQVLEPISTQRALTDVQDQTWSDAAPESLQALISIYPLDRQ
ncbi:hypothetical protein [Pseudomonas sp. SID14000]|uniref:hypothetical protein n=1 Tax=Pseudomonas sp. SID14000 TaxID=1986221 RepID=UPI000B3CC376|nr:hypothetical protein [Pseudomonas sp. SID14000]